MNNKMMKKAVAMIASLSMVCSMAISASSCFLFEQSSSSSNDSTPAAHICESVCPECEKCLDAECTEDACAEKCEGHEPAHECESVCPECGKCLDVECTEDACAEKCEGHEVVRANEYTQEAETVVCNGNVATGGDDQIWRQEDENRSGGMWLSRIYDVSVANPGHYYFKWLITVAEDCEVKVSLNAGVSGGINPAVSFPAKLNGADVSFTNSLTATGWDNYTTQKLGIINLTAGENIFYIYIGEGTLCNIDYFQFESDTNLTFNATLIDA